MAATPGRSHPARNVVSLLLYGNRYIFEEKPEIAAYPKPSRVRRAKGEWLLWKGRAIPLQIQPLVSHSGYSFVGIGAEFVPLTAYRTNSTRLEIPSLSQIRSKAQSVTGGLTFKTRMTIRPSEWNPPPVGVLAVVSAFGGATWPRAATRPVLKSVSFTYSRSPSMVGSILSVTRLWRSEFAIGHLQDRRQ
jgi:hypothetical protein